MELSCHPDSRLATAAAATLLGDWLVRPEVHSIMVAAGNSPLELYRSVAEQKLPLAHLEIFALDEYVGVPADDPRNCANLLRHHVADAWGIPRQQFHAVSSLVTNALASVRAHERRLQELGGIDVLVLGLGQNGHLGFNEPGSAPDSVGRLIDLEPISVAANREWFDGKYAPDRGVTVGLKAILAARRILILAFGSHKSAAVASMMEGPVGISCPASFLRGHPDVHAFVDESAAQELRHRFAG